MSEVILVEDEAHVRNAYLQALELKDLSVIPFDSSAGALDRIGRDWNGVLVTDIRMPGTSGLDLMSQALDIDPELPVILMTGHGDVPMAVRAMREGAYDFLEKPFSSEVLTDAVQRALDKRRLVIENRRLKAQLAGGSGLEQNIVGRSEAMTRLRNQIANFASADADVLILGETGAGKELVARSLHELSSRRGHRFVPINCGALPASVIESELFGHEPGAFTGAIKKRVGKFEYAANGTLFLDEIESMPIDLQVKILRVLEDRTITRLGSNDDIAIDVRIVAAAKEDLREAADRGRFREDLFYRLNVLTLQIPPLRDRPEDIPLIFHHFLEQAAARFKKDTPQIVPETLADLLKHNWPGNVRELQNAALRYCLGFDASAPQPGHDGTGEKDESGWLARQTANFERQMIQQVLAQKNGNLKQTYDMLGISRKTLYDKMQKYGIQASKDGGENAKG